MGLNYDKVVKEYIGEITYTIDHQTPRITLHCEVNTEGILAFVLCDELGKCLYEEKTHLSKGKTLVQINPSTPLGNGHYNAWIEIHGQTYLRRLSVQTRGQATDFFSRLKKWL